MNGNGTPVLDSRSASDFYEELTAAQPAFVPELPPLAQGSMTALMQILARFSSIVVQRLNQAPDLDKLAFLDMLGITLIPAQPARAPLVFQPLPLTANNRVPAGTRAGLTPPGAQAPIVFETENDIALMGSQLAQVVSLWPDQDGYIDHTSNLVAGQPFTLFHSPRPVEHVLYLAHHTLLAFQGKSTVEVRFTLGTPGSKPVTFVWEFWDGNTWRSFAGFNLSGSTSDDGTAGLTQSGVVTLQAQCGDSAATSVGNINNYWIRGRLTSPLPPDPSRTFAVAGQINLRTTIDRPLTHGYHGSGCQGAVKLDAAYAGTTTLDLTKIFFPLGKAPGQDSAFYIISEEVFSKPGAKVTLCFDKGTTPEDQADALGSKYAEEVTQAEKDLVTSVRKVCKAAIDCANTWINLVSGSGSSASQTAINNLQSALTNLKNPSDIPAVKSAFDALMSAALYSGSESVNWAGIITAIEYDVAALSASFQALSSLTAITAAGAVGVNPPTLAPARLVWEYYNGRRWNTVLGPVSDPATNLMKSGEISFTVPDDIQPFTINGNPALGMRARLESGSYDVLNLVSWTDPTSGQTNFIPVLQPRPPALGKIAIGYKYRSAWLAPEQSLSWNDFIVESHTPTATNPATSYTPYHPVADTLPALYLGFNAPPPNDYVSIFFDIVESDTDGPPLVWEAWSAGAWQAVTVSDDTGALARSGMVAFLDPGVPTRPQATVTTAAGRTVTITSALAAAVFSAGNTIVVQPAGAAEVVTIDSINGATLNLVMPLAGSYTNTTAVVAALPRFGQSLDWVRARLKTDGPPEMSRVNGIYPNAVWALQQQTVNNETLGSGTGQPNQSLFFQQFPVAEGEQVQVRELSGAQANVEYLVLQEQLFAQGFTPDDIRTVSDPRTGLITEVWVTWIGQPNFYFSGQQDRHYVLDRASGQIQFGNGINGMLPTPGNSNIVAWLYQAGGGIAGNVAAGAINQLLSGAMAQSVTNPAAAEGGADTEGAAEVSWRGPQVVRHRGAALSAADYEALALQASPGVAVARCLPATSPDLLPAPGWVTLIVVPRSQDPQPEPSYELKQEVATYISQRAPDAMESGRVNVIPPTYLPVGVNALVAAKEIDQSGTVKAAVIDALNAFLQPLYGGPDGRGWPFGRDVYLSDVAKVVEGVSGVDYVQQLELLLNLIPAGDSVTVPPNQMVAAGPMQIEMEGAPNV